MAEKLEGSKSRAAGLIFWVLGVIFSLIGFMMVLGRYIHLDLENLDEKVEGGVFYTGMGIGFVGLLILIIAGSVYIGKVRNYDDRVSNEAPAPASAPGES